LSTYNRTLSDSLTLSDLISNSLTRYLTDNLSLNEALLGANVIRIISDTLTTTDQFNRTITQILSLNDSITLSDAAIKNAFKRLTDSITAGDSISHQWIILRSIADTLAISDGHTERLGKVLSDIITIVDVPWVRKLLSDSIIISDSQAKSIRTQKKELIFFTGPDGNRFKRWTGSEWKTVDIITAFRNTN
jgi:hypothetical protein